MTTFLVAATMAALYASPAIAVEVNKHLGKVPFETFCKLAEPKWALAALNLFNYPHIPPPVANLPLTQKPRMQTSGPAAQPRSLSRSSRV